MFDPIKLLPKSLRSGDWADIVDTFYKYMSEDFIPNKIDIIKTQHFFDRLTIENCRDIAYEFSWSITEGDGYTGTLGYLKKEVATIVKRIVAKNARPAYLYNYYCVLLIGDVYPLLNRPQGLVPYLLWFTDPDTTHDLLTLDMGGDPIADTPTSEPDPPLWTLDDPNYPTTVGRDDDYVSLDFFDYTGELTRHILLRYRHRFLEDETQFHSIATSRAFFFDTLQIKRPQQTPHFEPIIDIYVPSDQAVHTKTFYSEDKSISSDQKSIAFKTSPSLDTIAHIKFGKGSHSIINLSITDVETELGGSLKDTYTVEEFDIDIQTPEIFYSGIQIDSTIRLFDNISENVEFSEIIIYNNSMEPLLYTTFPTVRFFKKMLSTVYLYIDNP